MDEKEHIAQIASRIFLNEGEEALSLRYVAKEAGVTTMAIYKHFGGKEGLLEALFEEGFQILHAAQKHVRASRVVPDASPSHRSSESAKDELLALCLRYRDVALRHPAHYSLMTGTHYDAPQASRQKAATSFHFLAQVATEALLLEEAFLLQEGEAVAEGQRIAALLFAFCHGFVSLELAAMHPIPEEQRESVYKSQLCAMIQHAVAAVRAR